MPKTRIKNKCRSKTHNIMSNNKSVENSDSSSCSSSSSSPSSSSSSLSTSHVFKHENEKHKGGDKVDVINDKEEDDDEEEDDEDDEEDEEDDEEDEEDDEEDDEDDEDEEDVEDDEDEEDGEDVEDAEDEEEEEGDDKKIIFPNIHTIKHKNEFYDVHGTLIDFDKTRTVYVATKNGVVFNTKSYLCTTYTDDNDKTLFAVVKVNRLYRNFCMCSWFKEDTRQRFAIHAHEFDTPSIYNARYKILYSSIVANIRNMDMCEYEKFMPDYKLVINVLRNETKGNIKPDSFNFYERLVFQRISPNRIWNTILGKHILYTYIIPLITYGYGYRWDIVNDIFRYKYDNFAKIKNTIKRCDACRLVRTISQSFGRDLEVGRECSERIRLLCLIRNIILKYRTYSYPNREIKKKLMNCQDTFCNK